MYSDHGVGLVGVGGGVDDLLRDQLGVAVLVVGVTFIGFLISFVFLKLLALDDHTDDSEDDDEGQVEVEPAIDAIVGSVLESFSKGELVRVASSVERDSTDEQVGARERSGSDDHGVKELEGQSGTDQSASDGNNPEQDLTLG